MIFQKDRLRIGVFVAKVCLVTMVGLRIGVIFNGTILASKANLRHTTPIRFLGLHRPPRAV